MAGQSWTDFLKTRKPDEFTRGMFISNQDIGSVEFTPSDDLSGFHFYDCVFTTSSFTVDHFKQIAGSSGTKFYCVKGFTFEDFKECIGKRKHHAIKWPRLTVKPSDSFEGISLECQDISEFHGLRIEHLKQARNLRGCITPAMGVANERCDGLNLAYCDISRWWRATPEHLNQAISVEGCKLPKMNLSTLDMEGKSFFGVDFGEAYGLTWAQCKKSTNLDNAKLPYMRIAVGEDFNLGETSIRGADFSKVQGLTEFQCKRIKELGGKNAVVDKEYQEKVDTAKKVAAMTMQIAEIISPTPLDGNKESPHYPSWLVGIAQSLAWVCEKHGLTPKDFADTLRNAKPAQIQQTIDELREQNKTKSKEIER